MASIEFSELVLLRAWTDSQVEGRIQYILKTSNGGDSSALHRRVERAQRRTPRLARRSRRVGNSCPRQLIGSRAGAMEGPTPEEGCCPRCDAIRRALRRGSENAVGLWDQLRQEALDIHLGARSRRRCVRCRGRFVVVEDPPRRSLSPGAVGLLGET